MKKSTIKRNLVKELSRGNLAIFAGAGLSKGAGYPDWSGLLSDFADELELSIEKENDLITLAQYFYNQNKGNRNQINESIKTHFSDDTKISNDMNILAELPIKTYWTTNYDELIERTLKKINKIPDIKRDENDLSTFLDDRDAVVYKMHGDVTNPHETVILRDDYEEYLLKRGLFIDTLCGELVSKTFIFIGYSFRDPNFEKILSRIRISLKGNQRKHYAFLKNICRTDYDNEEDYLYAKIKHKLNIEDLEQYSIYPIEVDNFSDITEFLISLRDELYKKNIFISGSAKEHNEDWSIENSAKLIRSLSERIIQEGFKIISGYGLGIGGYVIEGSSNAIHANKLDVKDFFEIHPFPQKLDGVSNPKQIWEGYRKKIISKCSYSIFVFGNKENQETGKIMNANGCLDEFMISRDLGLKIIPIGSTGYAAKEILNIVKEKINDYSYLKEYIDILEKSKDINELIETVIKILKV